MLYSTYLIIFKINMKNVSKDQKAKYFIACFCYYLKDVLEWPFSPTILKPYALRIVYLTAVFDSEVASEGTLKHLSLFEFRSNDLQGYPDKGPHNRPWPVDILKQLNKKLFQNKLVLSFNFRIIKEIAQELVKPETRYSFLILCRSKYLQKKLNSFALKYKYKTNLACYLEDQYNVTFTTEESALCFWFNLENPIIFKNYPKLHCVLWCAYHKKGLTEYYQWCSYKKK